MSKASSTQRRAAAAERAAAAKAREDRILTQIVAVAVTLIVAITLGVGYVVYDATRSKVATPAASPATQATVTPKATVTAKATVTPKAAR